MSDASKAVFISYAREDTDAARRIADALRSQGIEVWFDQNELRGGDAWDQKIRKQIADCTLFLPVISQNTQGRSKGYFRLEWKLAVENTHLMAEGVPYLAPIVVDDTSEAAAVVPPEFMKVQWTRLPGALPTPAFVQQIKRLLDGAVLGPTPAPRAAVPAGRASTADASRETAPAKSSRTGLMIGVVAAVVAVIAAGWYFTRKSQPSPVGQVSDLTHPATPAPYAPPEKSLAPAGATSVPAGAAEKSIAVLPFVNMSGDKDSEYFSDGLTEEILNALARNPSLRVAARTSSFAFKGKTIPMDEIGRALRAASLIEGSVRKSGTSVRITVQLINAADGYHVWSETFTKEMTDIFAVQDEIANKVAAKLGGVAPLAAAANGAAASNVPTKNLAAYDAYLRGRATQTNGFSESGAAESIRQYEIAVQLDPSYALALVRLVEVLVRIHTSGFDVSESIRTRAVSAAAEALRLAPDLPEVHLAQALVALMNSEYDAATKALDRVQQLRPNDPDLPAVRARVEYARGERGEKFVALALRAVEADPRNVDTLMIMAISFSSLGRYAEADEFCDRAWAVAQVVEDPLRVKANNLTAWTGDVRAVLALMESIPERLRENRFYIRRARLRLHSGDLAGARVDWELARSSSLDRYRNRSGPRGTAIEALYRLAIMDQQEGQSARGAARLAQALEEIDEYLRDFPDQSWTSRELRIWIMIAQGRRAEARAALDEMTAAAEKIRGARGRSNSQRISRAEILTKLGEADEAVAELRAAVANGYLPGHYLRLQPDLAPLLPNPQFQQLLKECEAKANAQPRPKK